MDQRRRAKPPADPLRMVGRYLAGQHYLLQRRQPSPLDCALREVAGVSAITHGSLSPWADSMMRAYTACGGMIESPSARRALSMAAAALAAAMGALNILDDLSDGDAPASGAQAPNLALALLGESTALLARLPAAHVAPMLGLWGEAWTRCAAAQAQDIALARRPDLTIEHALGVAEGCGHFTCWAIEAGAVLAGAASCQHAPLVEFGRHLGTAEKLLHDVHELWPSDQPARDLYRPSCSLALVMARQAGIIPHAWDGATPDADALRQHLLESGILHHAWAYADHYRLRAADALTRFERSGGDAAPLLSILALPSDLVEPSAADIEDVEDTIALTPAVY